MARAAQSRDQDVIEKLESIAQDVLSSTGFFHNGSCQSGKMSLQHGICRTNCVDCLDRTNACQFIIAKRALGLQLFALGIIDKPDLAYDTDAVNLLMEMFHDHGDTIALQYGGSHLVNTMQVFHPRPPWGFTYCRRTRKRINGQVIQGI
jgi:phosphatidylinositol 3,5-bisphosphate 5-phosphatase